MNGKVQYRGLPAPPLEALEFDDGMPPPCPRDMYSQYGVYDVIPGDPVSTQGSCPISVPVNTKGSRPISVLACIEEICSCKGH